MPIVTGLTPNTGKYTLKTTSEDASTDSTKTGTSSSKTATSLDSYSFSQEALSLANYLSDDKDDDSTTLADMLTENQTKASSQLTKEMKASGKLTKTTTDSDTNTNQTLADYMFQDSKDSSSSLYQILTYGQNGALNLMQKK
ncbi:MAG: hypothetical protein E6713_03720 [Sporomusaceae bacterium]|nr:hypothetical protein [Sporomusaceae bacterium]